MYSNFFDPEQFPLGLYTLSVTTVVISPFTTVYLLTVSIYTLTPSYTPFHTPSHTPSLPLYPLPNPYTSFPYPFFDSSPSITNFIILLLSQLALSIKILTLSHLFYVFSFYCYCNCFSLNFFLVDLHS